ncbi:hypothetical protein L6452_15065 [Arctium lappa]|uniref:Uncharacterized protein n=1 Tax=Arctium lappa TaxID=4217 RepID=A0ACB9CMR0_ARCLA|nr:hypothetical protein L6452_15065 [Arctium lappa]
MDQSQLMKNHVEKSEKFKGLDFRRWQKKMLFYLTTLHVSNVLTEDQPPNEPLVGQDGNASSQIQVVAHQKAVEIWRSNEYSCRNYILNALDDSLYDIYSTFRTTCEIWDSLDAKYKTEVACSKRFAVEKFLNYRMNDNKSVLKQVEELQVLIHELDVEGMGLNINFVVGSIIEKLPPSWKNFKLYLKHLTEEITFEHLLLKIRVEEDNKLNEKSDASTSELHANMIEFVCGKLGHKAKDCRHKRDHGGVGGSGGGGASISHAHLTQSPNQFVGVIETHMVSNSIDWWVDTGATQHICNSRSLFASYQKVDDGEPMFMGNASTAKIEGKGKVILKLTSGKDLMLMDVLRVPSLTKNLISGSILIKKGFKVVFESNKFVITKGGVYVGKGYLDEGLFKLSIVTDIDAANVNNNKAGTSTATSVYMVDPSYLWHSRLGHVNFRSLQKMIKLDMLPKCSIDKLSKCEICIKAKYTNHSHKSVEKSNEVLRLIHTDLCDFKATPSRGGKNYYITFINDCIKYCHEYLIPTRDEALNMFKTYKAEVENQLDKKIKILRSDRGGKYESHNFAEFCATHGIIHQTTAPYTPQQNGVGEACLTANMILNRISHKKSDKTRYELWRGRIPSYKRMKVWGCLAKVQVHLPKRTKLGPKTIDCVYIGPTQNSDAYRFLVYKSNVDGISNNTIMESAEAEFFKTIFPYKENEGHTSNPGKLPIDDTCSHVNLNKSNQSRAVETSKVQEEREPRRSKRGRVAKDFGPYFMAFNIEREPLSLLGRGYSKRNRLHCAK